MNGEQIIEKKCEILEKALLDIAALGESTSKETVRPIYINVMAELFKLTKDGLDTMNDMLKTVIK